MPSENVRFKCPGCGKAGIAGPDEVGKEVTCPDDACGTEFAIPEPATPSFRVTDKGQVRTGGQKSWSKSHTPEPLPAKIKADAHQLLKEYVPSAVVIQIAEKYGVSPKKAKAIVREARTSAVEYENEDKRYDRAMRRRVILSRLILVILLVATAVLIPAGVDGLWVAVAFAAVSLLYIGIHYLLTGRAEEPW